MSDISKSVGAVASGGFLTFTASNGTDKDFEVRYDSGTVWLTQAAMAELFEVDRTNITHHLTSIYEGGELDENQTCENFSQVQTEGSREVSRNIKHYNLDAIISVGYRVNSVRATQFRVWATRILRDFALRGYVVDRARMEQGAVFGEDYFAQLLQEIREIRLSERRFYQKITDIYATAADYDRDAPQTKQFFARVQNKMHFAVHGNTASELIVERADAGKPNMGLTSWAKAPDGKILATDVVVGKNYLAKSELDDLARLVGAFLDLAESRAERNVVTTMGQWAEFLDQVLILDGRELLQDAGKISQEVAKRHALGEFAKYRRVQDELYRSDFDRFVTEIEGDK